MGTFVSLGEVMMRLNAPGFLKFDQANQFEVTYAGGEANVAVSMANYGDSARFVTKLPDNEFGEIVTRQLRAMGVDVTTIARGGERLGIYFLETGASMRPSKVIYDRRNSAISEACIADFDLDRVFADASWFHFTGITPALSERSAKLTKDFLQAAKSRNVTVSCDLNYRKKLWAEAEAQKVMIPLMEYVDVCIGNEEDIHKVLGMEPEGTDVESAQLDINGYRDVFQRLVDKFQFKYVASSLRESYSASDNGWSAIAYDGQNFYQSRKYDIRLVDRVGGGDSFAGGLIHGLFNNWDLGRSLEFAVAASALKQTIYGDWNRVSEQEVMALVEGDSSGRVQR